MQIHVTVKQLGKKRPVITRKPLEISTLPDSPCLKDFITAVVKQQVQAFHERLEKQSLVTFLLPNEIQEQAKNQGKVGFGNIYNDQKVDVNQAIDNALLAFQDGIYCVFIDDVQIKTLDELITISPESTIAFIRLTFLAGSYW